MDYLKQNHLSILIIGFLVLSSFLGGSESVQAPVPEPKDVGAIDISRITNLFRFDAGVTRSYTNATSTDVTSYTAVAADIVNYDIVLITPTKGSLTITLPASSTLSSFVPTAGDMAEQCWHNATTTAGITLTIATATGIDLETASSTVTGPVNSLAIPSNGFACLKYIRKTATASAFDIGVLVNRYAN